MSNLEIDIGYSDWLFERIKILSSLSLAKGKNVKSIHKILEKCCENLEEVVYAIDR